MQPLTHPTPIDVGVHRGRRATLDILSVSGAAGLSSGSSQRGQGLVEYAFILGLVAVVVVATLVSTGHAVLSLFSNITSTLHQAGL